MRQRTRLPGRRGGFTIVELMVAMALIIFIMYILAEAFAAGSSVFRRLKAIGDMNARLRNATVTLRRLLAADHFEGKKRLSDPGFWTEGPPQQGFFRIWQDGVDPPPPIPPAPTPVDLPLDNTALADGVRVREGEDLDGLPSFRWGRTHLHFTARLRGNNRGDFFQAAIPPGSPLARPTNYTNWPSLFPRPDARLQESDNIYLSPWAETAVYLQPSYTDAARTVQDVTDDPNPPNPGLSLPLYTLYIRQRVLRPLIPQLQSGGTYNVPIEFAIPAPGAVTTTPTQNQEVSITRGGFQATPPPGAASGWGPDDNQNTIPGRGNTATQLYMNTPVDVTMPIRRFGWPYWAAFPNAPATSPDVPDLAGNRSPGGLPAIPSLGIPALPSYPTFVVPGSPSLAGIRTWDEPTDLAGTDVLLTDVISMDVRVLLDDAAYALTATNGGTGAKQTVQGQPYFISLKDEPYPTAILNDLLAKWPTPAGTWGVPPAMNTIIRDKYLMDRGVLGQRERAARVFDTWSSRKDDLYDYSNWDQTGNPQTIPMYTKNGSQFAPIRVRAIQITLRIWDSKTKQSRQVSLVQDL